MYQAPGPLWLPVQLHHGEQAQAHLCSPKALRCIIGRQGMLAAAMQSLIVVLLCYNVNRSYWVLVYTVELDSCACEKCYMLPYVSV